MPEQQSMTDASMVAEPTHDATLTSNKTILFAHLAAAGITEVIVEFDGGGDDGEIESITSHAGDKAAALPSTKLKQLRGRYRGANSQEVELVLTEAIEELTSDCLWQTEGGWENNEGAYGEFTFDVKEATIKLDFNARVIETISSSRIF